MKILHTTHSQPGYIPPPLLSADQVVFGPNYPDRTEDGKVISLKTQLGAFDIAPYAERLPPAQKPDLVVVRTDSAGLILPRNLSALSCPAVLVVGDTHHLPSPIHTVLDYALSEPFKAVILDYTRQHAHFFIEAGLPNVHWLPGFNVHRYRLPANVAQDIPFSFVGNVWSSHPRRGALCQALVDAGLPLQVLKGNSEQSRLAHARSLINFNCSLNGDLNLRVFEIPQSGGLLLTDRLSPEAGLDLLFEETRHFFAYGDAGECIAVAKRLLGDPATARRVAAAGKAHYEETLAPERIARDFFNLIDGGIVRPEFDLARDRRLALAGEPAMDALNWRIGVYQVLQELHGDCEQLNVMVLPGVDPRQIADLADLQRLKIAVDMSAARPQIVRLQDLMARAGLAARVKILSDENDRTSPDIVLATPSEWGSGHARAVLSRHPRAALLLTAMDDSIVAEMAAAGMRPHPRHPALFARS